MVEPQPRMPAAAYVRMSTEHQRYSPKNQLAVIEAHARRRGYRIVKLYEDLGVSGLRFDTRPGLKQLLADVLAHAAEFETVLVHDVSRWGRFQDPDESAHYEFLCRQAGVTVEYCAEPFENDGGVASALLKHMKRAMAAEYSRELSAKVARAQRRLAREGFWQGGPPGYGLRRRLVSPEGALGRELAPGEWKAVSRDRVVLVPGPQAEVALVRRIYRLFVVGGMSRATVARTLNAEGLTAELGARWSPRRVHQVLVNEKYVGALVFGKVVKPLRGAAQRCGPAGWTRAEGAVAPIVSRALFDLAQRNIARRCRKISDEEMLQGLRSLLARHGKITAKLIEAEEHLPCPQAYRRRWNGLVGAYAQVGYQPSARAIRAGEVSRVGSPCRRRNRRDQLSADELLSRLRDLLAREGRLTIQLMRDEPDFPRVESLRKAFGDLAAAYAQAGYLPDARQRRAMAWIGARGARARLRAAPDGAAPAQP